MSAPATLEHLRQLVIASARKVGREFRTPEDDWLHVGFVQTPDGVEILTLANDLFANGLRKDALAAWLRQYVRVRHAYRYAILLNIDRAKEPTAEQLAAVRREELRIEQIEGSEELLMLLLGDAEEEQVWMAPIERQPRTAIRRMGAWERLDEREGWSFEGRFAGLNEAMR